MKCVECKSEKFKEEKARFHPTIKDEQVDVVVEAMVCVKCGHSMMNDVQMDELRRAAADVYRVKHGLLTSKDIRGYRERLEMSQREFAKYLGVGEASIKRWETAFIQDDSQDALIRLKCDEGYAEETAFGIHQRVHRRDVYTGKVSYNFERVRSLVLLFCPVASSPLYLNKALFYVDFSHFKNHGRGITGMSYSALEWGPCPLRYDAIYSKMRKIGDLSKEKEHMLKSKKKWDESHFDAKELETIQRVYDHLKKNGEGCLLDQSHKEIAWLETEEGQLISYELADKLKF